MSGTPPPPLRTDIRIRKNVSQGKTTYILKEPDAGAYYRFEAAQYLMLTLFDGRKDPDDLVKAFDTASDEYAYDLEALANLIDSARSCQLLQRSRKETNIALIEKMRADHHGRRLQAQGSLLLMRFHLIDPNAFFDRIIDRLRWIWTPMTVKATLLLIGLALALGISQEARFSNDFQDIFQFQSQGGWPFFNIWLVTLAAIALHETAHGLTCKHFGGEVNDMGFLLLAFQPCLYCNVNDAWMFDNNRHKIYVALAGIWIELVLAAVAVFVWLLTDIQHPVGRIAFILVTISTAASLLMNLNPLLKYDGYYILSDWLQMPNLRQNAIGWLSYTLKARLFRIDNVETPLHPTRREQRIYLIYGASTVVYLLLILSGLGYMLHGVVADAIGMVGILLFFVLVARLVRMMTGSWSRTLQEWGMRILFKTTRRRRITVAGLSLFIVLLLVWSPRIGIVTSGKVDARFLTLYAHDGGFVTQVNYDDSRHMTAAPGQPLVIMQSPDRQLEKDPSLLRKQGETLCHLGPGVSHLPAPDGEWVIDGPPPLTMTGRYFGPGAAVLKLMAARQRHINVVLSQADLTLVAAGHPALIHLKGNVPTILAGTVWRVTPVTRMDGSNRSFQVRIHLHIPDDMAPPPPGTTGEVKILGEKTPLWRHVLRPIRQALRADLWI
ncbi:MAG: hypothetical protein HQL64_08225 [Magnetococcales bacterium]|nr:hypothetical protein [Magnetococcales bacterium]